VYNLLLDYTVYILVMHHNSLPKGGQLW